MGGLRERWGRVTLRGRGGGGRGVEVETYSCRMMRARRVRVMSEKSMCMAPTGGSMRPYATSVCGLKLLVYEAVSY